MRGEVERGETLQRVGFAGEGGRGGGSHRGLELRFTDFLCSSQWVKGLRSMN